jgi:hypothetical protein
VCASTRALARTCAQVLQTVCVRGGALLVVVAALGLIVLVQGDSSCGHSAGVSAYVYMQRRANDVPRRKTGSGLPALIGCC